MATIEIIIALLPQFLQKKPNALSDPQLANLAQILTTLAQRTTLREDMTAWFKSLSKAEKDALNLFVSGNREAGNQSAPPENTEAEIRQNLLEACRVLEKQNDQNPTPKDP